MVGPGLFIGIDEFPMGALEPMTVIVNGPSVGTFDARDSLDFTALSGKGHEERFLLLIRVSVKRCFRQEKRRRAVEGFGMSQQRYFRGPRALVAAGLLLAPLQVASVESEFSCPGGEHREQVQADLIEDWCATVGGRRRDGPYRSQYQNGQLAERSQYRHGVLEGRRERWYEDGRRHSVDHHRAGQPHGLAEQWRPDGTRYSKGRYENGRRVGDHQTWHYNGQLAEQGSSRAGKLEGPWKSFYANGHPREEGAYVGGKRDGPWKTWYPNGKLATEGAYRAGRRQGPWQLFHPNGQLERRGIYEDNQPDGAFEAWYSDGVLLARGAFEKGRRVETWEENPEYDPLHPSGSRGSLFDLVLAGERRAFGACDGKGTKRVKRRSVGGFVERGCLGPGGRKTGPWVGGYRGDVRRYEHSYADGELHGLVREWWENGRLALDAQFEHGTQHGPFVSYSWYGPESARGRYEHGRPVGRWQRWSPSGVLILDAEFDDEGRPLQWTRWDDDSNLRSRGELLGSGLHRVRRYHARTGYPQSEVFAVAEAGVERGSSGAGDQTYETPTIRLGRIDGESTEWSREGERRARGRLVDGRKQGEWTFWGRNRQGQMWAKTTRFEAGRVVKKAPPASPPSDSRGNATAPAPAPGGEAY